MIPDNTPIKQRLYITFGKFDALVYTSNLDVAKLWERVLRRANLPILYSAGFNQRPRIALASALPLGFSSECELLDVSLREPITLDNLAERLAVASPPGLRIYKIVEVPVRSPALQTLVRSSEYEIRFDADVSPQNIQTQISAMLGAETLHWERDRKGKAITADVRPLILDLKLDENGALIAHLVVGDQGNLRPDELVEAMGLNAHLTTIHRRMLHLENQKSSFS
jgi:radical SAM-linked protein